MLAAHQSDAPFVPGHGPSASPHGLEASSQSIEELEFLRKEGVFVLTSKGDNPAHALLRAPPTANLGSDPEELLPEI
jgi:hypothetical protein